MGRSTVAAFRKNAEEVGAESTDEVFAPLDAKEAKALRPPLPWRWSTWSKRAKAEAAQAALEQQCCSIHKALVRHGLQLAMSRSCCTAIW